MSSTTDLERRLVLLERMLRGEIKIDSLWSEKLKVGENSISLDSDVIKLGDNAADPVADGQIALNSADVKIYSGGAVRDITAMAAATGALTLEGSNTTEATTTSTSAGDGITISDLSIPATTPFLIYGSARKTSGAISPIGFGLKLNTTVVDEAVNGGNLCKNDNIDSAGQAAWWIYCPPRVTNYLSPMTWHSWNNSTVVEAGSAKQDVFGETADMPTATITAVIIRLKVGNASILAGVDEVFVYTLATS